jgi:hypothetical protein
MRRSAWLAAFCLGCAALDGSVSVRESLGDTGLSFEAPAGFEPPIATFGGPEPALLYLFVSDDGSTPTFPSLEVRALQASEPATVSKYVAAELARGDAVITPRPATVAGLPAVEFAVLQSVFVLHEKPPKGDSRIVRHSVAFEHRGHVYTCYLEAWPHQHAAYARVLQRFCSSGRRGSA